MLKSSKLKAFRPLKSSDLEDFRALKKFLTKFFFTQIFFWWIFFSGSNNFLTQKVFRPKKNFYPTSVQVLHQHEITKGFRLIKKGESPLLFLHSLLRRFPSNMKAKKRVIIYDFACKMNRCALFRFCHSPNSTSTQPQLNSTELGLTRKWLCTPPTPTTTTHPTTPPTQTQLPLQGVRSTFDVA